MALTPEEKNNLFRRIWSGVTNVFALPRDLYNDISNDLQRALFRGYGGTLGDFDIESPDFRSLNVLNRNIFVFSAAKTFQQVLDMQNFIFDERGFIRNFNDFKQDADVIFKQYNKEWLRTEFDTTIAQAQSASKWTDIQKDKDVLPLLQYETAGDDRVRPEHAEWDGIVRPVNDPFWDNHMPPNGFNCRCIVKQLEKGEKDTTSLTGVQQNDQKLFRMNPGKDMIVFKEEGHGRHPYFKVDKRFEVLKDNNFNLPLPE